MQVQPLVVTVLDVMPYNTFSIVCTATLPVNITAMKQFAWYLGSSESVTNLTSSTGTIITNLHLNNATSTSVLTTNASTPGLFLYTCVASVLLSQSSATTIVTVNGKSNMATEYYT